jgi:hypothetical protein
MTISMIVEQPPPLAAVSSALPPQNAQRARLRSKLNAMTDAQLWEMAAYMAATSKSLAPPVMAAAAATSGPSGAAALE